MPIGALLRSLIGPGSTLVFATAADTLYSRYALAYAASMRKLGIATFLVLCIDRGILTQLQAKRIPAYYDPSVVAAAGIDERVPAGKSFTAGWLARTRCKVLYTQAVVGSGYDIFFSDSDAAWLDDPRPFLRTLTAPLVVQLNFPQDQVNSGVFYMRATPATHRFLQLVNDLGSTAASRRAVRARIHGNFGIDDQAIFNYVLMCGDAVRLPMCEALPSGAVYPGCADRYESSFRSRHALRTGGSKPLSEAELQLANTTRYFSTDCPASARNGASRGLQLQYGVLPPTLFRTGSSEAARLPGKVFLVHLNFMAAGADEKWRAGLRSHYTAAGYDANGPTHSLWGKHADGAVDARHTRNCHAQKTADV